MTFQTPLNEENNRVQVKRKDLEIEIRSSWLGLKDVFQTIHKEDFECDVHEIRKLINK